MTALEDRIATQNEQAITALVEQLRTPLGVIPFVGAGFSAPFRFPQWGALLNELASGLRSGKARKVAAHVGAEEYERAATIVAEELGEYDFQAAISAAFPDAKLAAVDVAATDVAFVPLLASGLVITTNYDGVLTHVFAHAGRPFERAVYGANPNEIVPAIQQNRRTLWKLHGDRDDGRTRVLAAGDYDRHYAQLHSLLALAFANRPALFLGCALQGDRTVRVLADVHARSPGVRHFAVLQHPKSEAKLDARVKRLRELGVRPIWYPKGDYTAIRPQLSAITQRASAFTVPLGSAPKLAADGAKAGRTLLARELRRLTLDPRRPGEDDVPYPALLDPLFRGELVFFLGAAATLGRLPLAGDFYSRLSSFVGDEGELDPVRVTQLFADLHGRGALDREVDRMLGDSRPAPSALHRLIATLPRRLGHPLLIVTTNFDDCMERALLEAGEPHHLFTFRVENPYAGRFVHQRPDGEVSIVDRPERFHELPEEHPIVVKYHGGLHPRIKLPIAYAFARRDFLQTTRALPDALPRVLHDRLRASRLLFLGHGLADDSVESLVREIRGPARSWAIQREPSPGWRAYWAAIGIDILDVELPRFVKELQARLATR